MHMDDEDLHGVYVTITPFLPFITFSHIKSQLSVTHGIALATNSRYILKHLACQTLII